MPLALALALALAAAPPRAQGGKPAPPPPPPQLLEAGFEHDLSTPNGTAALTWPALAYDRAHDEVFVVAEGFVRIFNKAGMESFRFGDDGSLGIISRVAVLDDGTMLLLSTVKEKRAYLRCDYRGEPAGAFAFSGLPKSFGPFEPDQVVYRNGRLYFAERGTMRVVVTDTDGAYKHAYALRALVGNFVAGDSDRKPAASFDAFNVDHASNLLFTMSTLFAGATVTPSGVLRMFGTRGSTPGKFNIIGGIDSDEAGNLFVTDRLRSVVSVWDKHLRHLGDFGYRGGGESNLVTPYEIAVGNGKVFVAQAGNRGVKVFRVRLTDPAPPRGAAGAPPVASPALSERGRR